MTQVERAAGGAFRILLVSPVDKALLGKDFYFRFPHLSLPALAAYQGRLLSEGPQTLLAFLEILQETGIVMGKIALYASNGSSVEMWSSSTRP